MKFPRKTRFTQGSALLHEDIVTPMHHHREEDDHLSVMVDGQPRAMSQCEADGYVVEHCDHPELTEVDHSEGGPINVKRRHLLQGTAAGFGALLMGSSMPRYSFAAPKPGQDAINQPLLVCIFLRGGFDGLSAVVPVNDRAYYAARPGIAVDQSQTLKLDNTWGLNRNMEALHALWNDGDLAIVQGSGTPNATRSHFTDQASVERAAPANVRSGWLGRYLEGSSSETGTLRGVTVGNSSVLSLATNNGAGFALSSLADFDLIAWGDDRTRQTVRGNFDEMYGSVGGEVHSQADQIFSAIDSLREHRDTKTTDGVSYPDTTFGKGMAEVAKMANAGVGVEVACIDLGGWDMHRNVGTAADEAAQFSKLSRQFADALAAFRKDMGARWKNTIVVTMSEFGRRVEQNGEDGLDHGQGNTMFVMGGAVKGKKVYGTVPELAASNLSLGDVPITLDYRQALSEILLSQGRVADLSKVFPDFTPGQSLGIV